jgi:hypothetical protein
MKGKIKCMKQTGDGVGNLRILLTII